MRINQCCPQTVCLQEELSHFRATQFLKFLATVIWLQNENVYTVSKYKLQASNWQLRRSQIIASNRRKCVGIIQDRMLTIMWNRFPILKIADWIDFAAFVENEHRFVQSFSLIAKSWKQSSVSWFLENVRASTERLIFVDPETESRQDQPFWNVWNMLQPLKRLSSSWIKCGNRVRQIPHDFKSSSYSHG